MPCNNSGESVRRISGDVLGEEMLSGVIVLRMETDRKSYISRQEPLKIRFRMEREVTLHFPNALQLRTRS